MILKNQAILDLLAGVPKEKRTARFVCSIAAVLPDGREFVTRETMEGYIGGKIAGEQLIKLMTLGLTEKEAEEQIINGFLK